MFIDPYTRLPDSKNFSLIKDKNISGFQSVAKGHSSIVFSKSVWPIGGLARRENGWELVEWSAWGGADFYTKNSFYNHLKIKGHFRPFLR